MVSAITVQARIVLSLLVAGAGALGYGAGVWHSSANAAASVFVAAPVQPPVCPSVQAEKPMPFQRHEDVRGSGKTW